MNGSPLGTGAVRPREWMPWAAAAAAVVAAGLFAVFSGQVWEDYYITFRSSRHLAEGHGLVYQLGERVHTFTSPLGVLLPALGFRLTGSDAGALWFFRGLSALALGAAAWLVGRHAREQRWPPWAFALALGLGVLEAKIVAFTINGMETAMLVAFTALVWRELTRPAGARLVPLALGYAGLMWTRPDAFLLAGAMTAAWWLFREKSPGAPSPAPSPRTAVFAALLGALLYAPWLIWAWRYYGSPVPQTIIAKAALTPGGFSLGRIVAAPLRCLVDGTALDSLFAPIYSNGTGWPRDLLGVAKLLARLAAFVWCVPSLPRATRAASLATLAGGTYFHQVMPYPWYFGPWTLLGAIALAGAAQDIFGRLPAQTASVGRILAGVITCGALLLTATQAEACRLQQRIIEDGGRRQIGLWLREHAAPTDTVFLEPIGYVGYFSQLKVLDFPGLTAPEVSRLVRRGRSRFSDLIEELHPTWVVLRPQEIQDQQLADSGVFASYEFVKDWNQRPQLDACRFLPGRGWLEFDAEFLLLHRRAPGRTP